MLTVNQIIRYEGRLWRVALVDIGRAYIVPAEWTGSTIRDGGVSISPNSIVEVVSDCIEFTNQATEEAK